MDKLKRGPSPSTRLGRSLDRPVPAPLRRQPATGGRPSGRVGRSCNGGRRPMASRRGAERQRRSAAGGRAVATAARRWGWNWGRPPRPRRGLLAGSRRRLWPRRRASTASAGVPSTRRRLGWVAASPVGARAWCCSRRARLFFPLGRWSDALCAVRRAAAACGAEDGGRVPPCGWSAVSGGGRNSGGHRGRPGRWRGRGRVAALPGW